jgi:hypothetical protein
MSGFFLPSNGLTNDQVVHPAPKGKYAMKCKITVLRKTHHPDLAEQYTLYNKQLCDALAEGQEFIVTNMAKAPDGFCIWDGWIFNAGCRPSCSVGTSANIPAG